MAKKKIPGLDWKRWSGAGSRTMGAALGAKGRKPRAAKRLPGLDFKKLMGAGSRTMDRAIGKKRY